ncbi:hypothetical protein BD410DRAFT_763106 [Rickenella mellea]|uniref:Pentacotripeptide-repeat region of PRORP domain-containing protein n=1 Tax=Rickenella mellea TaxID=50990 RepID=A0A4Y7QHK0_9AGAM|nr:hypothetical protein BD410DRAFT_763106 [Rickenella mellea]
MSRSAANLPLALLDLTWARMNTHMYPSSSSSMLARARFESILVNSNVRLVHLLHLKEQEPQHRLVTRSGADKVTAVRRNGRQMNISPRSRASNAVAQLTAKVDALVTHPLAQAEDSDPANYTESQLVEFYADLLGHPSIENNELSEISPVKEDDHYAMVEAVARRLFPDTNDLDLFRRENQDNGHDNSLASRLRARLETNATAEGFTHTVNVVDEASILQITDSTEIHHRLILRLREIVLASEAASKVSNTPLRNHETLQNYSESDTTKPAVPIGILTKAEWEALVRVSIERHESVWPELILDLMRRSGNEPSEELIHSVLQVLASDGRVSEVEAFVSRFTAGKPTERQRDLHIKAHLKSQHPEHGVETALSTLHNYEAIALLPPMQSYTRLITALFTTRSSHNHAQAWDLFAHMRYVAHQNPDVLLYTLMIRACAGTGYSHSAMVTEPERALDLWREMVVDKRLEPTVGAYNAIILVCARSKRFAMDAFRMAKEMMDSRRDAFGVPQMLPDRKTFCALLVAAKMHGDLSRSRWILAEMLRAQKERGPDTNLVDEETMMHVFHAYASYRPPFRRGDTKVVNENAPANDIKAAEPTETDIDVGDDFASHFTAIPPQSRAEIIGEVTTLFNRILVDRRIVEFDDQAGSMPLQGLFGGVELTPRLLNAYLSVHYMHAPLPDAYKLFNGLFSDLGVQRNSHSYIEAMERCAYLQSREERQTAGAFGEMTWLEWQQVVAQVPVDNVETARMIERSYTAMIRLRAYLHNVDEALQLVRQFERTYPPHRVKTPTPKPEMRSTRAVLFAARPLIRFTSSTDIPDDSVPPLLTFRDLEFLHQRLVLYGRTADLAYLKYISKAYEGALRRRRDRSIQA